MSIIRNSIAVALCLPLVAPAAEAVDRMLQHVPPDTTFVAVVSNFDTLTSGLAALGESAGLDDLAHLSSTTALAELMDGNPAGLDPHGPLLLAMRAGPQNAMVIGTVADPEAWDAQPQVLNASAEPTFQIHGDEWFAGRSGRVILLARSTALLEAAREADSAFTERFAPHGAAMLASHPVVIWADVAAWQPIVEPLLSVAEGFVQWGLAMSDPEAEGQAAMWRWIFEETRVALREAETYTAGFTFDATGAFGRDHVTLDPDGTMVRYLAQVAKPSQDVLRGMVGEPGMIVFASEWGLPPDAPTISEAVLQSMLDTPQGRTLREDAVFEAGLDATMQLYRDITGNSGNMVNAQTAGFLVSGHYLTDRPQAVLEHVKQSIDTLVSARLMSTMSSQMTLEMAHRTESIEGRPVDVYRFSFGATDEHLLRMLHQVYGATTDFYLAPDAHGLAYVMGPASEARAALAATLSPTAVALAQHPGILAARRTIAPDPQVVVFLAPDRLVRFGLRMAQTMGGPEPPAIHEPRQGPLVAFGVYLDPQALRSEMFVPAPTVRRVVDLLDELEAPNRQPEPEQDYME